MRQSVFAKRMRILERGIIEEALAMASGNKSKAARLLGLSRTSLIHKMHHWGMAEDAEDMPLAFGIVKEGDRVRFVPLWTKEDIEGSQALAFAMTQKDAENMAKDMNTALATARVFA